MPAGVHKGFQGILQRTLQAEQSTQERSGWQQSELMTDIESGSCWQSWWGWMVALGVWGQGGGLQVERQARAEGTYCSCMMTGLPIIWAA